MEPVVNALLKALVSLMHPRMLILMIWPILAALVFWIVLAVLFWSQAALWLDAQIRTAPVIDWMITFWPFTLIAAHLAWIMLALAFIPMVLVTSVLIIGFFAMPAMVKHVAERDYPGLARRNGGDFASSVWNSVAALFWLVVLTAVTLPLWLLPLLWPILPIALFAWFNQRVFRFDALAEHASADERRILFDRHHGSLFWLGVAVSLASHIPLLGFFMPVYAGLAFIHFCLGRLAALRNEPIEGEAIRL